MRYTANPVDLLMLWLFVCLWFSSKKHAFISSDQKTMKKKQLEDQIGFRTSNLKKRKDKCFRWGSEGGLKVWKSLVSKAGSYQWRLVNGSKSRLSTLLGQWLNFKLFGITYLVGKIKIKLLFQGSIRQVSNLCLFFRWLFTDLFSHGRFITILKPPPFVGNILVIFSNHLSLSKPKVKRNLLS